MPRIAGAFVLLMAASGSADAQFVTYYSPVVAAPAPVVAAPVGYTVARPVVYTAASPVVAGPVVAAPAPVAVTVARPVVATTALAPTPVITTRFRPILGGRVTRVRYLYRPVTVLSY